MFCFLVNKSPALFAFLSGVFVSVATNTLSSAIFSSPTPANTKSLYAGTATTLAAAICWFALSEFVNALQLAARRTAEGFGGTQEERIAKALSAMARDEQLRLYVLYGVALALSLAWPLASCLG